MNAIESDAANGGDTSPEVVARAYFDAVGRFEGLRPNGARIDLEGCDVLTVRDGLIQRNDAYMNGAEMARQLGALPPAGSPPERALTGLLNAKTALKSRLAARRKPGRSR